MKVSITIRRSDRFEFEGEATVGEVLQMLALFFAEIDDPEQELARAKARLDASSKTLEDAILADPPTT